MTLSKVVCDCCNDTIEGAAYHVNATNTMYPTLDIAFDLCSECMKSYRADREKLDDEYFGQAVKRLGAYGK